MIVNGELVAGARLRQRDIAELFAVSTTPVREAFSDLAREGFVRQDAHRGVEVFRPSLTEVRHLYDIRRALEGLAAAQAAERIAEADLDELEQQLATLEQVTDPTAGVELNRAMHRVISRASGNPQLAELIERLVVTSEAYSRLLAAQVEPSEVDTYRSMLIGEQRAIYDALRKRSPDAAREAMVRHLDHNLALLGSLVLEEQQEGS